MVLIINWYTDERRIITMMKQEQVNECVFCNYHPCPDCGNILLREWKISDNTVALCDICGTVFIRETGEVLVVLVGEKDKWEVKALTSAILLT